MLLKFFGYWGFSLYHFLSLSHTHSPLYDEDIGRGSIYCFSSSMICNYEVLHKPLSKLIPWVLDLILDLRHITGSWDMLEQEEEALSYLLEGKVRRMEEKKLFSYCRSSFIAIPLNFFQSCRVARVL